MGTVKFVDVYSGNNFSAGQTKMDGYVGVIFKAGQGAWADVPRYQKTWWKEAKDAGLLTGWYWLADSRYHSSAHIDEIKRFPEILQDVGELGFWVDVEKPRISMSENEYWATPYAGANNVVDFVYLLTLNGVKPGIYTGPGAYNLVFRNANKSQHDYMAKFPLWTAQYPFNYIEGVSKPSMYGSWTTWEFWQWREGPDVNIYNGTDEAFWAKYGSNSVPPEPPTTGDAMYKGTVLVTNLNIRPTPDSNNPALGKLVYNDKVEATERVNGWWKLSKITRNGVDIPLPAATCYAYEGSTNGYIRLDSQTTPPTTTEDVHVTVDIVGGVTTVTVNGVAYKP